MRRMLTASLAAALMTVPTGCASNSAAEGASRARAADASGSAAIASEPPHTVKTCAALRKTRLGPTGQIPNPCAQAKHLLELYRQNKTWTKKDGFTLAAGKLGPTGLMLMVDGDVTAARTAIGDDPLVARIHSRDEGM